MKNEAEIIWWKTVKQDVETTSLEFTEAAARVEGADAVDGAESIFKRGCSLSVIIIYVICIYICIKLTFYVNVNYFNNFLFNIYI